MTDLEKAQSEYIDFLEKYIPWKDKLSHYDYDQKTALAMAYNSFMLRENFRLRDNVKKLK